MDIKEMGESFDVNILGEVVKKDKEASNIGKTQEYDMSELAEEIKILEENKREIAEKVRAAYELEKECDEQLRKKETQEERV